MEVTDYSISLLTHGSCTLCWISPGNMFPVHCSGDSNSRLCQPSFGVRVVHVLYQSPPSISHLSPCCALFWAELVNPRLLLHILDGVDTSTRMGRILRLRSRDSLFAFCNPGCSASAGDLFRRAPVCCIEMVNVQLHCVEQSYGTAFFGITR